MKLTLEQQYMVFFNTVPADALVILGPPKPEYSVSSIRRVNDEPAN